MACTHRPSRDSNRTAVLRNEDCSSPKPSPVQACNRFDCPPMWEARDWGQVRGMLSAVTGEEAAAVAVCLCCLQCSRSCGGGVQRRQVLCKQRLADGSVLELPDTFCPSKSPSNQQPCVNQECPPQWVPTDWSQVSLVSGYLDVSTVCLCIHRAPTLCPVLRDLR